MEPIRYALSSADAAPPHAPILLHGSIPENLEKAARLGYQGLEVHTREDAELDYDAIRGVSHACGTRISAIVTGRLNTQGGVNLLDDRPYITDAALRGMLAYAQMAARLETDLVVGWVKGRLPGGADPEPYRRRLARNLALVAGEAEKQGVRLMVEVINRYEGNLFTTAAETVDFLDRYEVPNCYVHLDTFHMNIDETDPLQAIRTAGSRLGYFHAADNSRLYPGSGTLDFAATLAALREIGYRGYVSVECLPRPDGETAAARALEHLKRCSAAAAGPARPPRGAGQGTSLPEG